MKKLVIIGGGFAGLWAAFGATRKAKLLNKNKQVLTLAPGALYMQKAGIKKLLA